MSSRGRGYGRGSYSGGRGSGYRGSYRGSSNRGSYESRGGRGGGSYSSYNNDTRYNSGGRNYNNSRDRIEESYKKTYRNESSLNYSNREYGGRGGSPERKRMRMEASTERRSHDGGGGHYGGYSSRPDNYGGERRSFGGEDRRRSPARESYRKPSGMGPPREPRSGTRPRRSFRGRALRSRASYRGAPRSRASFTTRFTERSLNYNRAFRSVKGRSSIKSKEEEASSTEEDWDAEDKEPVTEEKKEQKIKSPKVEPEDSDAEAAVTGGVDDTDKEPDAASDTATQSFVNLVCVHCKKKCANFGRYAKHLVSVRHRAAMGVVARRHKTQLLRMRVAQRAAQRELETTSGADLAERTTFCPVCRLNHRTTREAHNLSDTHRAMKRFLMPFCRICRITYRSPMIYEHHICSLEHIKKKANKVARCASPKAEGSGDEGMDVDLDNFMTLDSVGDVDEVEDDDSGTEKKDETSVKNPKVEINIGSEHIKKLEVWWCELCRTYLTRAETGGAELTEVVRRHCRLRLHLGRYVQYRDTRTLRKHAERIHRQLHQQKQDTGDSATNDIDIKTEAEKDETVDETKTKLDNGAEISNTAANEDKLWADVDKDIGELLREVDPQGNEGTDDEEDLDRYEKYRKTDTKKLKEIEEAESDSNVLNSSGEKKSLEVNASA